MTAVSLTPPTFGIQLYNRQTQLSFAGCTACENQLKTSLLPTISRIAEFVARSGFFTQAVAVGDTLDITATNTEDSQSLMLTLKRGNSALDQKSLDLTTGFHKTFFDLANETWSSHNFHLAGRDSPPGHHASPDPMSRATSSIAQSPQLIIDELQTRLSFLQEDFEELQSKLAEKERLLEEADSREKGLLELRDRRIAGLEAELEQKRIPLDSAEKEIRRLSGQLANVVEEKSRTEKELKEKRQQIEALKGDILQKNSELQSKGEEIAKISKEKEELQSLEKSLHIENEKFKGTLDSQKQEYDRDIDVIGRQIQAKEQENNALRAEETRLQKNLEELQSKLTEEARLLEKAKIQEKGELEFRDCRIARLEAELEQKRLSLSQKEEEIERLRGQLEDFESFPSPRREAILEEPGLALQELEEKRQQIEDLKEVIRQNNLKLQLRDEKIEKISKEKEELQAQTDALRLAHEENSGALRQVTLLRIENERLKETLESQRKEHDQAIKEIERQLRAKAKDYSALQEKQTDLQKTIASLEVGIGYDGGKLREKTEEVKKLQQKLDLLEKNLEELKERYERSDEDVIDLTRRNRSLSGKLEDLDKSNARLQEQLRAASELHEKDTSTIVDLEKKLAHFRELIKLATEHIDMQAEHSDMQAEHIAKLEKELRLVQRWKEEQEAKEKELRDEIKDLNTQLEEIYAAAARAAQENMIGNGEREKNAEFAAQTGVLIRELAEKIKDAEGIAKEQERIVQQHIPK